MTKAVNIDAFAIPLTVGTLGEASRPLNKRLLAESDIAFEQEVVETRTGINIDQTESGLERKYDSYKELKDIITEFARPVIADTGTRNDPADIESEFFWVNRNESPNAYHMPHSHQLDGYMWTGVYFPTSGIHDGHHLSDDEDLDVLTEVSSNTQPPPGSLTIMDPIHYVKTGTASKLTRRYPYWGNPYNIPVKEGTIVLFPTYLPHLVTPTEKENFFRLSIAFYVKVHRGNGGVNKVLPPYYLKNNRD
jgi:hypothetical protein